MVVNRGPVLRAAPLSSTRQGNGFLEEVGQVGVVEGLLVEVRGLLKEAADWRGAASAEVLPEGRAQLTRKAVVATKKKNRNSTKVGLDDVYRHVARGPAEHALDVGDEGHEHAHGEGRARPEVAHGQGERRDVVQDGVAFEVVGMDAGRAKVTWIEDRQEVFEVA